MLLINTQCGKQFSIKPNRYTEFSTSELNDYGFYSVRVGKSSLSFLVNRGNGREVYTVSSMENI